MSKPTPGPWTVILPGHGSETEYLCVQIGEDDSYTTLEMLPADARLISAAPDMLDALLGMMTRFERTGDAWMHDPAMVSARAALKKARGEEE